MLSRSLAAPLIMGYGRSGLKIFTYTAIAATDRGQDDGGDKTKSSSPRSKVHAARDHN
ncbi:MAG: hypothetical protein JWO45_1873, partial [Spartobacteria bacterium]|nr:hypothetical protein [Spartobacteria bacterium]